MASPVFCHYMVGGMSEVEQALTDVTQAKAMGFDAFALNVISTDAWSTAAIALLFQAAATIGFRLFFSFDMSHFTAPSQFFPLLQQYVSNPAYYKYNSLPFVSTFCGGMLTFGAASPQHGWNANYKQALASMGINTYFVPSFSDALSNGVSASNIYTSFPVADGIFSWDTAWPWVSDGKANVSSAVDQQLLAAAKSAKKTFMMPMSTFQFKHLDNWNNWYRRGELNLVQRIPQIMTLRPDFVEFLTWNDGGESSYIGNLWPEAIGNSPISRYTDNYDHSGWGAIIKPFITAYKAGKTSVADVVPLDGALAAGVFWHRTILTTATCASDPFGKPQGWSTAEDVVNVAVLLSKTAAGASVKVYSGGTLIGTMVGITGMNTWSVPGLMVGAVKVVVIPKGAVIVSATGAINVAADAAICNYNYQVVALK